MVGEKKSPADLSGRRLATPGRRSSLPAFGGRASDEARKRARTARRQNATVYCQTLSSFSQFEFLLSRLDRP